MSETASATVTYTPLESGNEESRWIRLEQVQATLPGPSVGDAAYILDLLYNIEPCDDGMGGGGEEADEENEPSAEDVDEELSILLENNGQCRQGYWLAAVNVYRTHRQPGYELRSETATVETVKSVEESYRQEVDVNGPLIALERPYAGGLSGIPRGVKWEVRGATVNLDRPVHDHLILRYNTWHEYVTLRVPTKKTDDGEEYEPAAVVAFWGDMAVECTLDPPEPEDEEDDEAKRDLCNRKGPDWTGPNDCWKTVGHYSMCECSKRRVNEWEEQVGAPCDGFPAGAYVGHEEHFDGYIGGRTICGDDEYDDELRDPEFYKKHCCKPPVLPWVPPRCRRYYAIYNGGHAIENGPAHWKNIYGENVRMIAVMPEQGYCGEKITEWNIPQKNCCDDVEPMTPHPDNPVLIEPGKRYEIRVNGGKQGATWTWRLDGGLVFSASGKTWREGGSMADVRALPDVCPHPTVSVDDGCYPLTMTFRGEAGEPPQLSETDLPVAPNTRFVIAVSGGGPPYTWQAGGGIKILGWNAAGTQATFEAGAADEWCVSDIVVVDHCGREAVCTVRNTARGRWVPYSEYELCSPPGAPFSGFRYGSNITSGVGRGGYYIIFQTRSYSSQQSCADALSKAPQNFCPNADELFSDYIGVATAECAARSNQYWSYQFQGKCCVGDQVYGLHDYRVDVVNYRLYQWVCQ